MINDNLLKEIIITKVCNLKGNLEDEVIYLIGKKIDSGKNSIYKDMQMIISDSEGGKSIYLELNGLEGYNPRIIIEKYKNENKNQILFTVEDKKEERIIAIIYDLIGDNLIDIFNTDKYNNEEYKVKYKDNYKIEVINDKEGRIYNIDIGNREKNYINNKYDKDGILKRNITGKVLPIYDMVSVINYYKDSINILIKQKIIGESTNDVVGELINILVWENDEFKVIDKNIAISSVKDNLRYKNNELKNINYDFSKIDFIESEYKSNYKLERAVEKEYLLIPKYDKFNYLYNKVNLKGFTKHEILVYLEGPKFCSENGGTLLVINEKNSEYIINSKIVGVIPPVIVCDNKNNGYNDLIIKIINKGNEEFRILKYNGNSYPIDPLKGEKLRRGIKISGIAVISDDLFYRKGIEY